MPEQIQKAIEVMQREYEDAQRSYNNAKMYGTHEIIVKNEGIVFAYETALSALRAQLERMQGCEYCDFSSGDIGACIKNTGDGFILVQSSDGVMIATDDSRFSLLKIKFCPMCGREL